MDPVQTLEEVAQLAVPRLADWCAVQLAADMTGFYEQVAVAHVDPDKVRWARELQDRYPPDPDSPTGAPAVIRTGRSELYPVIDSALLEAAALDEEQIQLVRDLQMHSVMVVPLAARGRTLGAITFVWAESERQYSTRELELAEELGRRAGLALDHARLFAREHATAEKLQRALLPAALPELPGHELVVRYVPSDARDHAGGDWYDAFWLPDGRFGIVIGDVGGRGMDAAATMGQIRNALRAYALKGAGTAEVLDDLHHLVAASAGAITFATVIYVVLDPATGEGELATAGHLPALLVGEDTRYVDAPRCPPLGFSGAARCEPRPLRARPGRDAVAVHRRPDRVRKRPLDTGLAALADAAGARRRAASTRSPTSCWSSSPPRATTTSRCSASAGARPLRRRCSSAWRRTRDTCICERPTRSAISRWTRSSTKRSRRISRSRGVRSPASCSIQSASSTRARPVVLAAEQRRRESPLLVARSARRGWTSARRRRRAAPRSRPRSTSRRRRRPRPRSGNGRDPGAGASVVFSTRAIDSCTPRERWIAHVLSRKWRLSSPRIVGTA